MELLDALDARSGVVCVVGAGGKKTTLYTLAARADNEGLATVVTATVRIPIFDSSVARVQVTQQPEAVLAGNEEWPLGLVPQRDREDRYEGYEPTGIDRIAESGVVDVVLVKADGARTREFKAPGGQEPQIPGHVDTVLPVASVQVVGEPLGEEAVHRPERVSAITGLSQGEEITAEDVADVLTSPDGGLKGIPTGATVVPLLNKVDDNELAGVGRKIANKIHDRASARDYPERDLSQVVLASMTREQPLVDVIE